jgi:hypothetical protein
MCGQVLVVIPLIGIVSMDTLRCMSHPSDCFLLGTDTRKSSWSAEIGRSTTPFGIVLKPKISGRDLSNLVMPVSIENSTGA